MKLDLPLSSLGEAVEYGLLVLHQRSQVIHLRTKLFQT